MTTSLNPSGYKMLNTYNKVSAGNITGPKVKGPNMGVQRVPQTNNAIKLNNGVSASDLGSGHFSMKNAYNGSGNGTCNASYNFRDCSGKNIGKADRVVPERYR